MGLGDGISCFVVSELIEGESIASFMVDLFRILFVDGDVVMPFPEVFTSALRLLDVADGLHFAVGVNLTVLEL